MKPEFTPDGIQVQTFQEIYDELAEGYRDIYGQDINLEPDSPDGQRVAIESQARLDLQSYGAYLYTQVDPDTAIGQALNVIIKLAGITRRPPTRSQVDIDVTTDRGLTLPDDYTVEDDLGQAWTTLSEVVIAGSGTTTVTLFAENFGAVEADPGTVTEPATVVIGVTSVTNPAAATVGMDEETDQQLRVRRNRSLENPATSTIGGLFTVVGDLPGVTDLEIYENDTDTYDPALDVNAHTIWLIVEGGSVDDIVEAMAKNKTGGTGMKGAVMGTYTETLQKPDGTPYNIIHEMQFDRPTLVDLYIRMTVTRKDSSIPADVDLIEQLLVARDWNINENALASDLYRTVYEAGDTFVATDLEISLDGMTGWTDGKLETMPDEKFRIQEANIDITEVI